MIWFKIFNLVLFAICAGSGASPRLFYAVENGNTIDIYKADLNLNKSHRLFIIHNDGKKLDTFFIIKNNTEEVLYYSLQHSTVVGFFRIGSGMFVEKYFGDASWEGIYLGPSSDGNLYFYFPDDYKIRLYEVVAGKTGAEKRKMVKEMGGVVDSKNVIHCFARDPRNDGIFFVECSDSSNSGKYFDMKEGKILEEYTQSVPICFDKCAITPDGQNTFGVKGNGSYFNEKKNTGFRIYYNFGKDDVTNVAIGNNEIFYTTKENGKILKVENIVQGNVSKSSFDIQGKIIDLFVF